MKFGFQPVWVMVEFEQAAALTSAFRATLPTTGGTLGHFIGRGAIESILEQTGCVGIRVYYGINSADNTKQLVFTGVDADENDMYDGYLADKTFFCPNLCGVANPLNSDV